MATLNVKHFPDPLYEQLQKQAAKEHRSVAQQVIHLVSESVRSPEVSVYSRIARAWQESTPRSASSRSETLGTRSAEETGTSLGLTRRVSPRLCRGDSHSLTIPGFCVEGRGLLLRVARSS